jgi:hypothetical protein
MKLLAWEAVKKSGGLAGLPAGAVDPDAFIFRIERIIFHSPRWNQEMRVAYYATFFRRKPLLLMPLD